jgi:hypothetical protein
MNNIQKRFVLFLGLCIPIRSFLIFLAYKFKNNTKYLKIMGLILLVPAIVFLYIYITNSRKTGAEVFGGNIWWNDLRPIHGINYLMFSIVALSSNKYMNNNAWKLLLIDVILGLSSFIVYHYQYNSFGKLL